MSAKYAPEDTRLWIEEAQARLNHAEQHVEGRDGRIYCEQAHYAAEMAIKAVIIANKQDFSYTHDISILLDQAKKSGEEIPPNVHTAKLLTPYGGAGRYRFEREKKRTPIGDEETKEAIAAATATVAWATERIERTPERRSDLDKIPQENQGDDATQQEPEFAKPGTLKIGEKIPDRPSAKYRMTSGNNPKSPGKSQDDKTPPTGGRDGNGTR